MHTARINSTAEVALMEMMEMIEMIETMEMMETRGCEYHEQDGLK